MFECINIHKNITSQLSGHIVLIKKKYQKISVEYSKTVNRGTEETISQAKKTSPPLKKNKKKTLKKNKTKNNKQTNKQKTKNKNKNKTDKQKQEIDYLQNTTEKTKD